VPLPRYGVAIGTFVRFARDPQDSFGHWYHGHLTIATPAGEYQSALDVDTPSGVGVSFRVSRGLRAGALGSVGSMADGWHPLASTSASGALDYLRSPVFRDRLFRLLALPAGGLPKLPGGRRPGTPWWVDSSFERLLRLLGRLDHLTPGRLISFRPWIASTGDNALTALETELPGSSRIYLFGEHYETSGLGVHDVHMNQGDPAGSQWWDQNGIWQDGAVGVQKPDGTLFLWQVRFNSQAMLTDDNGHPP
jgi:hypothetical protein